MTLIPQDPEEAPAVSPADVEHPASGQSAMQKCKYFAVQQCAEAIPVASDYRGRPLNCGQTEPQEDPKARAVGLLAESLPVGIEASLRLEVFRAAAKELRISYHNPETTLSTIRPYYIPLWNLFLTYHNPEATLLHPCYGNLF